jgi:hypothetical protein
MSRAVAGSRAGVRPSAKPATTNAAPAHSGGRVFRPHRPPESDPLNQGLAQLDGHLDRLSLDTGALVIFDRRPQAAPIIHRTTFEKASPSNRAITVLRA